MKPPSILPNLVLSLLLLVPGQAARATDVVTVLKMTSYRQSEDGPVELVPDVPPGVQRLVSPRFGLFAWSGLDSSGVLGFLWLERGDGRRLDLATGGVMQVFDGFDSAGALEAAYPAGSYLLRAVQPDDSESRMALRLDGGAFPPAPRLTNIRALSSQEGASEFVLAWDPFVGGTTNDMIVLSEGEAMSSHLSGTLTPPPGHPRVLDGTATSVVLRNHVLTSTNQFRLVFIKVTDRQTQAAGDWVGITGMASETVVGFSAVRGVVSPPRDTNAPVLVDHDPADGQTNVWAGSSVRFDFDRPMADVVSIGWSTNIDASRMSCQWSGDNPPQTFLYCNYAEPLPSDAVVTWVLNPTGATGPAMAGTNGVALPANQYSGSFRTMKTGSTNLVGVGVFVGRTFRQLDGETIVEEDEANGFMGPSGVYAYFDGEVARPFQGTVTLPDGTILEEFPDWGIDYHSIDLPEGTLEAWDGLESKAPIAFDLRPGTGTPLKATVLLDMGVEGLPPRILRLDQVQSVDSKRDFKLEWEIPGGGGEYFYQSFDLSRTRIEPGNPDEEDPFHERYRFEDVLAPVTWPDWYGFFEPSPDARAWVIPAGSLAPGASYEIRLTTFRYRDLEVSGPPGTWGSFDYGHTLLFTLRTTGSPDVERWIELGPTTLPSAAPGVPLNVPLQASGGTAPYRWSLVAGSELPAGVTLTSDGRLTGTPGAEGVFQFGVRVVDTPSQVLEAYLQSTAARTYRLQVGSGSPPPEPRPVLALDRSAGAGALGFGFPTRSGSSYRVESSRDLREWSLVRRVAGTGATVVVRESVGASEPGRFFRVVVE